METGPKIAVIGCGVSGLTTAVMLQENGYAVTIFSEKFFPNITSDKAAAFWSPYYAYGERASAWARYSHGEFEKIAAGGGAATGVSMTHIFRMTKDRQVDDAAWSNAVPEGKWRRLEPAELAEGYQAGYKVAAPLIETPLYLPYLTKRFLYNGGKLTPGRIRSLEAIVAKGYDAVINCSGFGARMLCGDTALEPVRGQIALVDARSSFPIFLDEMTPTYIVQRSDGCVLGGIRESGAAEESVDPEVIGDIIRRCAAIDPGLKNAPVIRTWAGIRPFRHEVRLEKDPVLPVIHNYGHGGAGFTLSWGCAREVTEIIQKMIDE